MAFSSQTFLVNDQSIHAKMAGPNDGAVMLMLHGFPEYWAAWSSVAKELCDRYRVVLPDQRGFNLSSKPADPAAYETKHLVADMKALVDVISPDSPVVLCGHDWGASVAYAFAMRYPKRISHLIIANGVHPICFQKALLAGGAQTDASQYMNVLRAKDSEKRLSANRFEKLANMFEKFSSAPWLSQDVKDEYRAAWGQEGALSAMLNWYRGSPMVVPPSGQPGKPYLITANMREKYRITMPHLLLWGVDDPALLPEARADLADFCDDLTVQEAAGASHWILHEKPQWVAGQIRTFLS